jgi:putative membrane protein insertion efficiency factor
VIARLRRTLWILGWPARQALLALVLAYRVTFGRVTAGRCRFYPSCSEYALRAIRDSGAVRGLALAAWRVARCSPLSSGGVDHPPARRRRLYDTAIQGRAL